MIERIRELMNADPFVRFLIVLTSGDRYEIENPELLALGRSELTYYYPRSDRHAILRASQIAAVERLEGRPAA